MTVFLSILVFTLVIFTFYQINNTFQVSNLHFHLGNISTEVTEPIESGESNKLLSITQLLPKIRNLPAGISRKKRISDVCNIIKNSNEFSFKNDKILEHDWNSRPFINIRVILDRRKKIRGVKQANILQCIPPKTGTSSWEWFGVKNIALTENQKRILNAKGPKSGTRPSWLGDLSYPINKFVELDGMNGSTKLSEVLFTDTCKNQTRSYFKLMNTRHPFDRIHSAWSDKFVLKPSVLLSPALMQSLSDDYKSPCHSDQLMNKMRQQHFFNTKSRVIKYHSLKIQRHHETSDSRKMKTACELVSFTAFLNYILGHNPPSPPNLPRGNLNAHWEPIYSICQPCHIKYDLIASLETADDDSAELASSLNFADSEFPRVNNSTNTKANIKSDKNLVIAEKYSRWRISEKVLAKLYEKFMLDFEMFGYDYDRFLSTYQILNKRVKTK